MQIIVAYSVILLYNDVDINAILLARLKRIFLENKTRGKIGKTLRIQQISGNIHTVCEIVSCLRREMESLGIRKGR